MKTLIILPGWGGTKQNWQEFIDLAHEHYDVKFLEFPCFGGGECPATVWGIEEFANFVKTTIDERLSTNSEGQSTVILGHSFGGQVASYLVAKNPGICDRLILSGASIIRREKSLKQKVFGIVAKIGKAIFKLPFLSKFEKLAKKVLYKAADSPDYNKTSGMQRKIFQKIIRQDVSPLLPEIKVSTLIIWGSEDSYVPLTDGQKIAKIIPDARLKIFQGGKHGAHMQQPGELLTAIKEFTGLTDNG